MADSQPPHSPEAERAVLGAMIVDLTKMADVWAAGLREGDFYDGGRAQIYQALLDLDEEGADYITLCDLLQRRGQLEELGGYSEITRLITACATSAHAVHYAKIVKLYAIRRRLIAAAGRIAEVAYEGKLKGQELEERVKVLVAAAFAGDDETLGIVRKNYVRSAPSTPSVPRPAPAAAKAKPLVSGVLR